MQCFFRFGGQLLRGACVGTWYGYKKTVLGGIDNVFGLIVYMLAVYIVFFFLSDQFFSLFVLILFFCGGEGDVAELRLAIYINIQFSKMVLYCCYVHICIELGEVNICF